jgi:ribosomal protein L40E
MICDLCGIERDLEHVCIDALKAENAKLRERVHWLETTNYTKLRADYEATLLQVDELKERICAGICGVDFPGFEAGEHMTRCPLRTPCKRPHTPVSIPTLYEDGIKSIQCGNCEIQIPLLPLATERPNHVCEKCGAAQPPMSIYTFGVCQKCGASFSYAIRK